MDSKSIEGSEQSVFRTGQDELFSHNYVKWSSRFKCFQAYVCYTMNFQTILSFSMVIGEFGLVALLPYFIFRIFVGIPAVLLKVLFDRYIFGNISNAWTMTPFAKAFLHCSLAKTIYITISNGTFISYLLKYLLSSLHATLPWEICDSSWARENCYTGRSNTSAILECMKTYSSDFCHSLMWESSATQYWKFIVADNQSLTNISYSALSLSMLVLFLLLVLYKGIRSFEKFFLLFVYIPVIMASILASITLLIPGVFCGSAKVWYVDYSNLLIFKLWANVYDDTLLALGMGLQSVTFVSAHGRFTDDFFVDVLVVCFSDLFCCLLFAAPILSSVGAKVPCEEKRQDGKYFADKVYVMIEMTEAMSLYPSPKMLWSFLFFLEMYLISCGTQSILILSICETIEGFSRHRISHFGSLIIVLTLLIISCTICIGVGMDFNFLSSGLTTMGTLLMITTVYLCYGFQRTMDDFHFVMGYVPPYFLRFCWILLPFLSVTMLSFQIFFIQFDEENSTSNYVTIAIPLGFYVFNAIIQLILAYKRGKISNAFLPNPDWGPQNHILKVSRVVFNSRSVTKESLYRQELDKKPQMKQLDFSQQNIVQPF